MGAVAQAVGDFVGDAVESVGNIASSAVREIGKAAESVGREVGKIGQAAINDPIGTIAKVGAVASGQWWALPLVSAGLVIANGGDIGQAALSAGISLAAQGVAYGVGQAVGAGSSAGLNMASPDAVGLASQGLSAGQIAQVLGQSYPEIGSSAISQIANMAKSGIGAAQIVSDVGKQMAVQNLGANTAANAVGSGARTALSGGNLGDILTSAGTAGLGTGVGGGTSLGLGQAGVNSSLAGAIGKGAGAAAATAAQGRDGTAAFLNSLIDTTLSEAGAQTKSMLRSAWNSVTSRVEEYNEQLEKTKALRDGTLTPLEQKARAAAEAVQAELESYQPVRDKFSSLVEQYDAAKASGDVELANSLADQANALIPELNAATEKYNSAFNDYETKLASYKDGASTFEAELRRTNELKASYEQESAQLTKETQSLSEAVDKVVDMPEPVKEAFSQMYKNGTDITTALDNATKLSGMSSVAQETFINDFSKSNDINSAFGFADKVNGLDYGTQTAYSTALNNGFDYRQALDIAPRISGFNSSQQADYINSLKQGYDDPMADFITALSSFSGKEESINQANLNKLTDPEAKAAYERLVTGSDGAKFTPEQAMAFVTKGIDPISGKQVAENIISALTGSGNAQAGQLPQTTQPADTVEGEYHQDRLTGKWGIYVRDPVTNQLKNTNIQLASADLGEEQSKYREGERSGNYFPISKDSDGVPNLSMIPVSKPTENAKPAGQVNSTKEQLDFELQTKQISQDEYNAAIKNATGVSPNVTNPPQQGIVTNTPSWANYVDNLLSQSNKKTSSSSPTVSDGNRGGTSTVGTATDTIGTGGTTGVTGGASTTGNNVVGGASTGANVVGGANGGIGAGTGGTGTGIGTGGGTGTGTGGFGFGSGSGGYQTWSQNFGQLSQDQYGGITNLTPGLTKGNQDYTLSGLPTMNENMNDMPEFAAGGYAGITDLNNPNNKSSSGLSAALTPGLTKAQINYILTGLPNLAPVTHAEGGSVEGHNPTFFSEGGLGSIENRYAKGDGDGTSDEIPAMLAHSEFVIPADVVSSLGNGSSDAGAQILDEFLKTIREHKRAADPKELPPDSKGPLAYLLQAQKKVKS